MKKISTNKGIGLLELMVSILISSILISMLLSLLTMALNAKADLDVRNKMENESYIIAETVRNRIFDLEAQEIILMPPDAVEPDRYITIQISHLYDIYFNDSGEVAKNYLTPKTSELLTYDKNLGIITYDGDQINSDNIFIEAGTNFEIIPIFPDSCGDEATPCEDGIIKLTLVITIVMDNGTHLTPVTFITTIIV